jgi:hypothetical protein
MGRGTFRIVMDRSAKIDLHLCACHGDTPEDEPPIRGEEDELWIVVIPILKEETWTVELTRS